MYKKAQAAMEFLMTYGWAILVVLIAIGALTYLVDFKSLIGTRCQLTAPLYCKSQKADSAAGTGGQVTLLIRNALPDAITVTGVNLVNKGCDVTGLSVAIASNADVPVTINCGVTAGEKVKTDVRITYDEAAGGLTGLVSSGNLVVSAS